MSKTSENELLMILLTTVSFGSVRFAAVDFFFSPKVYYHTSFEGPKSKWNFCCFQATSLGLRYVVTAWGKLMGCLSVALFLYHVS